MSASELQFKGYAVHSKDTWDQFHVQEFTPKRFEDDDVDVKIRCCGVCASDVHVLRSGWMETTYPIIVGHEIVGTVVRVGKNVTEFKPGDRVGVGAQVGSCMKCRPCVEGDENYCLNGHINTYGSVYPNGDLTHGGYSTGIRAHQQFVFSIPDAVPDEAAAPMLCAGLTVFSPLKQNGCKPGSKVAVVGIGGLGHLAIMFAKAMGAEVTAISHSTSKKADALKMGASHFIVADQDGKWAEPLACTFDIIISTRNDADFNLNAFLRTLYVRGKYISVGLPEAPFNNIHPFALYQYGCYFGSSHVGNKKEAVEMLQLAAEKGIRPWVEVLPMSQARDAVRKLHDGAVRYRTVLTCDL